MINSTKRCSNNGNITKSLVHTACQRNRQMTTNNEINGALLRLTRRAEANEPQDLIKTFVALGHLIPMLQSNDHQVVFGRRGTGKTHVFRYLQSELQRDNHLVVYVDLRTIGSSGGIYSDPHIPTPERGTRLLVETLEAIHTDLRKRAFELADHDPNFGADDFVTVLDSLANEITKVQVVGKVEISTSGESSTEVSDVDGLSATFSARPSMGFSGTSSSKHQEGGAWTTKETGIATCHVHFGALSRAIAELVQLLPRRKLWLLLDEWSTVPLDLQPYLADLIRRSIFPVRGTVVKIAAIEARSVFSLPLEGEYLGIEIGADAASDVDLDDFMVFGNDPDKAEAFFADLFFRHLSALVAKPRSLGINNGKDFVNLTFTQQNAFTELVRAGEGVPRDAINILCQAAQRSGSNAISVPAVRDAAARWYIRDKEKAIEKNQDAKGLLIWIRDEVIGHRKARAFLLEQGAPANHHLIQYLHDARVLHVVRRGVASKDNPGVRYNIYGLDYGCYADLINTSNQPKGLLVDDDGKYLNVPTDDLRSIRRAILDLEAFDKTQASRQRIQPIIRRKPTP